MVLSHLSPSSSLAGEACVHGSPSFTLKKSRQEIADSFAIQKFSLQRCLNEFAAEGAITLDGKNITIIDAAKVRAYASI